MSSRVVITVSLAARCARMGMACCMIAMVAALAGCQSYFVSLVAYTPNRGAELEASSDRDDACCRSMGADRFLRVRVGPPDASIGAWIIDPPGERVDGPAWPGQPTPAAQAERPPVRGTIIVLHGITDGPFWVRGKARAFARHGYRAVLVGLRGYAESTGDVRGYGVYERDDLTRLVDALDREGLLVGPLGAWGVSYGGATAIQFAGADPRVRAVVSVAAFADMITAVPTALRATVPIAPWLHSDESLREVACRASAAGGFDIADASAVRLIEQSSAAVLLIHGEWDLIVPYENAERIHAAAAGRSRILPLPATGHFGAFLDFDGRVESASVAWFDAWLDPSCEDDRSDTSDGEHTLTDPAEVAP